jgi:hypothetical protein
MKKTRILALIVAVMMLVLSSCSLFGSVADEGGVTVVVENGDSYEVYTISLENVENKSEGAWGVLEAMANREKNALHLVKEDGGYGAFITEIGGIKQDASAGAYIMVYTSVDTDSYEGSPTKDYNGTTLYQSGVGASDMTITDGTVILFRLEVYEY